MSQFSLFAIIAGSTLGALGAFQSGQAAKSQGKAQAEVFRRQAERERQIGELNAKRIRDRTESVAATQRAFLAANGVDPGSGSGLLLQDDLEEEGELNARISESNTEGNISTLAADRAFALAKGKSAQTASFFRAGRHLLSGAGAVAEFE